MVWGAFIGFNKSLLVIIPQGERSAIEFVYIIYKSTLNEFYFMHDQSYKFPLIKNDALVHCGKFLDKWRQAHGIKKLN